MCHILSISTRACVNTQGKSYLEHNVSLENIIYLTSICHCCDGLYCWSYLKHGAEMWTLRGSCFILASGEAQKTYCIVTTNRWLDPNCTSVAYANLYISKLTIFGLNGGESCLLSSLFQSIDLKKIWSLIGPRGHLGIPSLTSGSFSNRFLRQDMASLLRYRDILGAVWQMLRKRFSSSSPSNGDFPRSIS